MMYRIHDAIKWYHPLLAIFIIIVVMLINVQSALAQPYFIPPDPKVLMVMEMKPGCRSDYPTPACIGAMKSLNRSIYYYDQDGKLKQKMKSIWERR